jgi:CO/xanthine dehydrogenase FAD-binding subunit
VYFGSHSAIPPFRLERPATVAAALKAKAAAGRRGAYLGGGVDLVPALRAGTRRAECVIALGGIADLAKIAVSATAIRIGALVTYRAIETDRRIAAAFPELSALWRDVANIRTRHAATIGGNLMARDPSYDLAPALVALDAFLVFASLKAGRHVESAFDVTEPPPKDALLKAVEIPRLAGRRFAMDRSLKPVVSVAASVTPRGDDVVVRAAFGCAFDRVAWGVAVVPAGATAREAAAKIARKLPPARGDAVAGAAYRRRMAETLLARRLVALGLAS